MRGRSWGASGGGGGGGSNAIDVIIVQGQSNARGTQDDPTVPGGYTTDSNVTVWNGSAWVTYLPQTIAGMEFGVADGAWSFEMEYSRQYRAAYPSKKLAIIKTTASGTQLHPTGSGAVSDWSPTSTGEYFDTYGTIVSNAMAALVSAGLTPTIRLLFWMQGENDANLATPAANYYTNMTALVAAWRNASGSYKVPATAQIAIGRISAVSGDASTNAALVRNAQIQVGADKVGGPAFTIDTDGMVMSVLNGSSVHYQNTSMVILGKRMFDMSETLFAQATADAFTPVNTEVSNWLARLLNVKPSLTERQAIDAFVTDGKTNGWWSTLDAFYLNGEYDTFYGSRQNMVANAYNLTTQLHPVHTPRRGDTGTSTAYFKTGFTPSSATTPKYVQDSAHLGFWSRTDTRSNSAGLGGNGSSTVKATINPWNGTLNAAGHALNGAATANTGIPSAAEGHFVASRTASTGYSLYRNGTSLITRTDTSTGVPAVEFRVLSDGLGTNLRQVFASHFGSGLTAGQVSAMSSALVTLVAAYGAQWVAVAPTVGVPTITGTRTNGSLLTAASGTVTGEPTPVTTWQWTRAGADISGATAITYTQQAADVGNIVSVRQIVTSSAGTANATAANGAATT
jgi:hypothetical protein